MSCIWPLGYTGRFSLDPQIDPEDIVIEMLTQKNLPGENHMVSDEWRNWVTISTLSERNILCNSSEPLNTLQISVESYVTPRINKM